MILQNGKRLDGCSDTVPVGTLQPYLGLVPPKGYLLCQGQLVSKTIYSRLYEICGSLFGEETDTEFRLPDLRGKTIVGFDEGDTLLNVIGEILGSKTHTHTSAEHNHTIEGHTHTSAAHTHSVAGHTHTSAAHTHTTGNHTLTVAEIPAHSHAVYGGASVQSSGGSEGLESFGSRYSSFRAIEQGTYNTGGGGAHNHGNTGSTTPGNTGSTSLTTDSTTPDNTGFTTLTTNNTKPGDTGEADNYQPSIVMNWMVKAVMLIPEYFVVENTLNSDSEDNALSAKQGKLLNEKFTDYPTRAELLQYTNDYIIESGDQYRKWASGVAEAWGACYEYADPMVGTSVGNIYRCDTPLQINLPAGVFVDTPNISTDLRYCTVVSWIGTLGYENNATQIRSKYIMSPVSLSNRTVEYYVDWYAIGKWK